MKTHLVKPVNIRRAFTLIELIVVLTILVGLAGILIPTLTNMVGRTNRSTTAINISEIAGAIQRFEAIYVSYPDNFDSLMINATGDDLNTLSSSLAGLTGVTTDVTLTAGTLASLNNVGISNVGLHATDDTTFDLPTLTPLTDTTVLKGLNAAHQEALGLETTGVLGKYIVLGIGSLSELTGTIMVDAPVHFPRDAASNPDLMYSRFLAVFQITDGTADPLTNALDRARFTGILSPDGAGLSTQLGGYFNIAAEE